MNLQAQNRLLSRDDTSRYKVSIISNVSGYIHYRNKRNEDI